MKQILVDAGNFYTKVYVMRQVSENGAVISAETPYQFYGRGFFPTLVRKAGETDKSRIYYEHGGELYTAGYDCSSSLRLEEIIGAFDDEDSIGHTARVILQKIIFDYADSGDELKIDVVVDSGMKAQLFDDIAQELQNRELDVAGFRGFDRRRIEKKVKVHLDLLSSGDAVEGFLDKKEVDFGTALAIDVGYRKTKVYVVDCDKGVERFHVEDFGVAYYYEKMVQLFAEEKIEDNHFLWLVKQIELGCDEVEIRGGENSEVKNRELSTVERSPRYYDISLVMENVRWDLNKEFKRMVKDTLTSYYTNRVEWTDVMVVTGGGASLNGDLLRLSLEEDGYCFNDLYIEKQPIYTVLEGACHALHAPHTE